jgi:UDP-GlcNAc:undecaprenyl-phosphate/decaprenyl-phosphate GlcNAc-1-phosphate transferase
VGLLSSQKSSTVVAVAIPVVSLGLPVLDTLLAIVRRFLRGQPIFVADRGHIHHRLLSFGWSPRRVALLLYVACALLALSAMLLVTDAAYIALVLVVVGLGVGLAVQRLRFHEFEELADVVRKGVRQRDVIGRGVRIREASAQLSQATELAMVFPALERTFQEDEFLRAEMRLRRQFIECGAGLSAGDRRADDDVVIWSWSRNGGAHPDWWEVRLPFNAPTGECIGSLVLWGDSASTATCLSTFHTLSGPLRSEIERKLLLFWAPAPTFRWADAERLERVLPLVVHHEGRAFPEGSRAEDAQANPVAATLPGARDSAA